MPVLYKMSSFASMFSLFSSKKATKRRAKKSTKKSTKRRAKKSNKVTRRRRSNKQKGG